jgi:thiamine-phosphate pyrophosphorylase
MLAPSPCQTEHVEQLDEQEGRSGGDRRDRLRSARLYLVCGAQDDRFLEAVLRGGVEIVQLRLKEAGDQEIISTSGRFARACAAHGALFILNDRPDLVARCQADGVHVGQDDMPVGQARALAGPDRLVGLSTHSRAQIDAAAATEAPDYIGVGPVYETPTKPGRAAVGLDLVTYAAARAATPFFAIGGIDEGTVGGVVAAGARRVAVVRALVNAPRPEAAARRLRQALQGEREAVGAAQP